MNNLEWIRVIRKDYWVLNLIRIDCKGLKYLSK